MSASVHHHDDRAVVCHDGPLTWAACLELVGVLETAVDSYFYTEVELIVSSPGGETGALLHVLGALARWRRNGVRLRTRVISTAASAAAILVCIGDERIADPGAMLLFHDTRAVNTGPLSARDSAQLHSALRSIDEGLIRVLVERAVSDRNRVEASRFEAEESDRRVLEHLYSGLDASRNRRKLRGVRALARAIGRAVDKAVRANDASALCGIYRRLAECDRSISASLALTLRLIDRIGPWENEQRGAKGSIGLVVPQWRALYPPEGGVPRELLTRHTLVLGETGSGKTASAILPVVAAAARAPADRVGAVLVIDPKCELGRALEQLAPGRVQHLRAKSVALDVMSGGRWRLAAHLDEGRWSTAALLILSRVASMVPGNPARVLGRHSLGGSNEEFFAREGTELAQCVLGFVLMVTSRRAPRPGEWLGDDHEAADFVEQLLERARGRPREPGPNAIALTAWALDGALMTYPERGIKISVGVDSDSDERKGWLFTRLARAALAVWGPGEGRDLLQRIIGYWDPMAAIDRQYAGVRATARVVCADFASPAIARSLYFGCEPGCDGRPGVDFVRAVSREGNGPLLLFQPARDGLDGLIAVALKALFFEAVLNDPDRVRGSNDVPLVGYVADEFHRFITSDPIHGEQSFLDSCRSFGTFCVLACQSIAALEHALASGEGSAAQNEASIAVLANNTASKLFFRTTDAKAIAWLRDVCPTRPGRPPVSEVRPLSTLAPGECFATLADGRFERRQLDRHGEETPPERTAGRRPPAPGRDGR